MTRKPRPGLVDEFRATLEEELDNELVRLANLPNISVTEIYNWLVTNGYKGSLNSTYTWYTNYKRAGEKAQVFNALLKEYEGVEAEKVLQRLLVTLSEQLDTAINSITTAEKPVSPTEYLRLLPQLGRELRSVVTAINTLQFLKERRELEMAGALRMANELKNIFKDTPFEIPLSEGVRSIMLEMEEE